MKPSFVSHSPPVQPRRHAITALAGRRREKWSHDPDAPVCERPNPASGSGLGPSPPARHIQPVAGWSTDRIMGLSEAVTRKALHKREIELNGYEREDGLFDIEARLADTKTYGFALDDRGWLAPGDRLHGMSMRLTVDIDLTIVACEAVMDDTPYAYCPSVAPNFAKLAGLRIGRGFLRAAAERVGGTDGCTHLRELLQPLATVAFQTVFPRRQTAAGRSEEPAALLIGTCHAFATDSPVVARRWPERYTGK